MSVLNELAKIAGEKYLETGRVPILAKLPSVKYDQMFEEMKGCLRLPPREEVYGELEGGGYGWRLETQKEYSERINRKPTTMNLVLATGIMTVIAYHGSRIEVELEA